MKFLLDADTCVFWLRGRESVHDHMANVGPQETAISVVTLAELRYGAACSAYPEANNRAIDDFISEITVVGIESEIARAFGTIKAYLRRQGMLIEDLDLLVAATALTLGMTLITNNTDHFSRVPGLLLDNWLDK